ncbi:hypothetical protein [Oceanobacillus oncorhynchi]|uniref:hypothetical protein n=1 Tax=Oceanobacillus oncorhynchi TaxID=545501 RepID=UPI0034D4D6C2
MTKEYAVYKGDNLIAIGTKEHCAKVMGVTPDYIYWLTTPAAERRLASRKNPEICTVGFELEED